MINMLINSAIIRKREFALLQAVGMTNRQLRKMLYREGMSVSIKSALLAAAFGITIGGLLCYLANKVMALKFVIFAIDPLPVLLFAAVLILMQKLAEVVPLLKLLFLLPYVLLSVKRLIMIQPNSNKKGGTLCEVIFKNL